MLKVLRPRRRNIGDCAACILPGATQPLPPRAQTARQQADYMIRVRLVKARLGGAALPQFKYRDLGSLVSLADYNTLGVVLDRLKLEGLVARLTYRSLHQMHLRALHGNFKATVDALVRLLTRRTEPRIKLH